MYENLLSGCMTYHEHWQDMVKQTTHGKPYGFLYIVEEARKRMTNLWMIHAFLSDLEFEVQEIMFEMSADTIAHLSLGNARPRNTASDILHFYFKIWGMHPYRQK